MKKNYTSYNEKHKGMVETDMTISTWIYKYRDLTLNKKEYTQMIFLVTWVTQFNILLWVEVILG